MLNDGENPHTRNPFLVQVIVGWSIARAVIVALVLIDWGLFIKTTSSKDAVLLFQLFAPGVLLILSFVLLGIAISKGKNWGRVGYLVVSLFVILRPGPNFVTYQFLPIVYSVFAGLIALWLLNHPSVLSFFRAIDFRPNWISNGVFGLSWDLLIGIVLLVAALAIEISRFLIAYAFAERI